MPQLVLLIAIGAGAYVGYRWLKGRVRDEAIARSADARGKSGMSRSDAARDAGNLVWDETKGVYRPRD